MLRETEQDLINEAMVLDHFANKYGAKWTKLGNGAKYRIDAAYQRDGKVVAWAEVKVYKTKSPFLGVNVPKMIEGCQLALFTGKPFFLLFHHNQRFGMVKISDGEQVLSSPKLRIAGGTPPGRKPLGDDIEPMFKYSELDIKWG
jgi:hypothetical protein